VTRRQPYGAVHKTAPSEPKNMSKKLEVLSIRNEIAARRLGWTPESQITWREFLEQYPYGARETANRNHAALSTAA
jgi:hypothetical protein